MEKVSRLSLIFDLSFAEATEASPQWILSAMQKHGPGVVSMLWRILGNEQDVCDIYQDTFLQLAHCRSGRKPDHVKSYLFKSASNNAISLIRRKKKYDEVCQDYIEANTPSVSSASQDFDRNILLEEMRNHLARLTMAMGNFRKLNAYQLSRQNAIAAAQSHLDSYTALGHGLDEETIHRLWPGIDLDEQLQPGQGNWAGFTLIKISSRTKGSNKHHPIELSRYVPTLQEQH
jgi:RNA polymerase sigma factor (sigma-70 family)